MALPALGCTVSVLTIAISILPNSTCVGDSPAVAPRCLIYQSRAWAGSATRMWTLSIDRFGAAGAAAASEATASTKAAHIVTALLIIFSFERVAAQDKRPSRATVIILARS